MLQALKMNSFIRFFMDFTKSLSNFVRDFCENSFCKPKLILTENMLIYLNISKIRDIKIHKFRPVLKKSYLLHKVENGKVDNAKIIILSENNYRC